jgi:hypothetical protein
MLQGRADVPALFLSGIRHDAFPTITHGYPAPIKPQKNAKKAFFSVAAKKK